MIDIIIPAYNCENTLETTVKSIEKSGLSIFNIIIVDDGSKDDTKAVCEKLCREFENVTCIFKNNGGVSSARNEGLRYAKGEYVLFFDSDDTVDEGGFSGVEALLSKNTPDMLVFGMMFDFYKKGRLYRTDELVYEKEGLFSKDELLEDFYGFYNSNALTSSCNKFIKRSIITENKIEYDEKMIILEDFLFSLKCFVRCESIYCLKKPIYRYRQPENEKRIIARLAKTPQTDVILKPFEAEIEKLRGSVPENGNAFNQCRDVLEDMFLMLIRQKSFMTGFKKTSEVSHDFKNSKYMCSYKKLSEKSQKLYIYLAEDKIVSAMLLNRFQVLKRSVSELLRRFGLYDKIKGALK